MVRVKICGITNRRDAFAAVDAGADALGFNFWPRSPRRVTPAAAASIVRALPPTVTPVGVFVDEPPAVVEQIAARCGLRLAQLCGREPAAVLRRITAVPVMKAVHVRSRAAVRAARRILTPLLFFDAYDPRRPGGTGRTFAWGWLRAAALPAPFYLAGGLTPENVGRAVRTVRPFGVDVASGVEAAPGRKDHALVRRFIRAARAA